MKRFFLGLLTFLLILMFSGCFDSKESDEVVNANAPHKIKYINRLVYSELDKKISNLNAQEKLLYAHWYGQMTDMDNYKIAMQDDFAKTPYLEKSFIKLSKDIEENKNKTQFKIFATKELGYISKYNFKQGYYSIKSLLPFSFFNVSVFKQKTLLQHFNIKYDNFDESDMQNFKFYIDEVKAKELYHTLQSKKRGKTTVFVKLIFIINSYSLNLDEMYKMLNKDKPKFEFNGIILNAFAHVNKVQILTKIDGKEKILYTYDYKKNNNN